MRANVAEEGRIQGAKLVTWIIDAVLEIDNVRHWICNQCFELNEKSSGGG